MQQPLHAIEQTPTGAWAFQRKEENKGQLQRFLRLMQKEEAAAARRQRFRLRPRSRWPSAPAAKLKELHFVIDDQNIDARGRAAP
jgi:hypothetical protein